MLQLRAPLPSGPPLPGAVLKLPSPWLEARASYSYLPPIEGLAGPSQSPSFTVSGDYHSSQEQQGTWREQQGTWQEPAGTFLAWLGLQLSQESTHFL